MSSKKQPVRVMVVDDDPLIQAGIKGVLESDSSIFVVASASSGTEALDLIDAYRPDVLLLDIQMPGLTGLDVLRKVRQRPQRLACVIVTTFGEDDYVLEAVRFDADGFVLKAGDPSLLLTAVHAVAEGGAFSPHLWHAGFFLLKGLRVMQKFELLWRSLAVLRLESKRCWCGSVVALPIRRSRNLCT